MPFALLLAMQASGMVIDYLGNRQQQMMSDFAARTQQAGIEANIEQTRLESEEASLQAMKNLRQQLGTQIATFAARGTSTAGGSAVTILNESLGNFASDERVRKLNLLGKENQLRGGIAISRLKNMSDNSKLWQSFAQRSLNRFPTSVSGWQDAFNQTKQAFGMTPIGS